ncbi:DNA-directed RNA polymerase specialized sigma24 family protein [Mucilaginibacter sp. UYNi724]|jgi:DNA-directed RNA polymerase specialized sigma24 family protein
MELIKQKNVLSPGGLLERLRKENWEKLIRQLHYYSLNRLKKFPQLEKKFNLVNLANHLADEAIRQLWMQERVWDTAHYPDVYVFLKSAVDSLRYNFLKSKEQSVTTFLDEAMADTMPDSGDDPQAQLETKELEDQVKAIFDGDPEAYQVFDGVKNGLPAREISLELGLPVKEVYNAMKRIDRKLIELRKTLTR